MKPYRYVLDENRVPVAEPDLFKWARWFENTEGRAVKQEKFGRVLVSTVFLGLDHNWSEGPPILWETMIFNGRHDGYQTRCAGSWEQAEAMHATALQYMRAHRKSVLRSRRKMIRHIMRMRETSRFVPWGPIKPSMLNPLSTEALATYYV